MPTSKCTTDLLRLASPLDSLQRNRRRHIPHTGRLVFAAAQTRIERPPFLLRLSDLPHVVRVQLAHALGVRPRRGAVPRLLVRRWEQGVCDVAEGGGARLPPLGQGRRPPRAV